MELPVAVWLPGPHCFWPTNADNAESAGLFGAKRVTIVVESCYPVPSSIDGIEVRPGISAGTVEDQKMSYVKPASAQGACTTPYSTQRLSHLHKVLSSRHQGAAGQTGL